MDQVHVIRHKVLVDGRSQRQVAKELGISRVTVRKYLEGAAPVRREASRARGRSGRQVGPRIEALLAASKDWTGGKQQLTATRLHELLIGEGHRVGASLVKAAVAEWKRQRREVFVPLTYRPGRSRRGGLLRGARRRRRHAAQGVALPDAADVLGPRLRAGSTSGRTRSAFWMAMCARSRTSAASSGGSRTTISRPRSSASSWAASGR